MRRIAALIAVILLLALPSSARAQDAGDVEVFVEGFEFLSNLAVGGDGTIFAAEKDLGTIRIVRGGRILPEPFVTLDVVTEGLEQGLLGIALHPEFPDEPWVYAYLSDARDDRNRVIRIRAEGDRAGDVETVIDLAETTFNHLGGDITFGPDGNLYIVTGDATVPERSQAPDDVAGKILRLAPDGGIPADNPFGPGSPVYSLGHRNSFGLCVDPETGQVWETENGPESHDEINRITAGANYGWPEVSGPGGGERFVDPVIDYPEVIVVTGCALAAGRLWWTDFSPGLLHHAEIRGDGLGAEQGIELGQASDVVLAPDGFLYLAAQSKILRLPVTEGSAGSPTPAESSTASPASETPSPTPSPTGERRQNTLSVVIVAVLLALGIIVMRSRIRPPEDPPDPMRV